MARGTGRRVRRGEAQWAEILRRFETAGQGTRVFCRREGLALSSFQRWRKRLAGNAISRFVELVPSAPASTQVPGWTLEVSLPNGALLRLRG